MTKSLKTSKLPLIDNPAAPDLFADEVVGYQAVNNTIRFTLAAMRADHAAASPGRSRAVVGRLIMPLAALEHFQKMLTLAINNLKSPASDADGGPHTLQ